MDSGSFKLPSQALNASRHCCESDSCREIASLPPAGDVPPGAKAQTQRISEIEKHHGRRYALLCLHGALLAPLLALEEFRGPSNAALPFQAELLFPPPPSQVATVVVQRAHRTLIEKQTKCRALFETGKQARCRRGVSLPLQGKWTTQKKLTQRLSHGSAW